MQIMLMNINDVTIRGKGGGLIWVKTTHVYMWVHSQL